MYYSEDYEQQANEEASYWFCVQEVSDYVQLFGLEQVMRDVFKQIDKDKHVVYNRLSKPEDIHV